MESAISPNHGRDTAESDHDFAFQLQLQEALAASLSFHAHIPHLQRTQDSGFYLDRRDRPLWDLQPNKNGEGASSSASSSKPANGLETFRVYFKSYLCDADALIGDPNAPVVWGIGVAICDLEDNLVFKLGKTMRGSGRNRLGADCSALIEALNAALSLNLTRVEVYFDSFSLFQFIRGRWRPKQSKIRAFVDQVSLLRNNFAFMCEVHVAQKDIKHVFKLAREAVDLPPESSSSQTNLTLEICVICLDNKPSTQMLQIDSCSHCYCFSCMKQHVKAKLLDGILPKCPHENCNSELTMESCKVFLPAKLIEMFSQQMKEASIPAFDKVYCPFPKCSTLMSKKDITENLRATIDELSQNGARKCVKCEKKFCINCKVPWHKNLSCSEYKEFYHDSLSEEVKLKNLADVYHWRQCKMCSNMIELATGCHHITCRCGYEFCYSCGGEWKNKMATCFCPLWSEGNIMYNEEFIHEYEYDDVDYDYDYHDFPY